MVGASILPPGLDHFTVYAGLLGNALELGKLIATEKRDLQVIESHYRIQMATISSAFRQVEAAMVTDFQRDESLREKTFEAIKLLIAAGQFEIALEFQKVLVEGFKRSSLEAILEHRNTIAGSSRLSLR